MARDHEGNKIFRENVMIEIKIDIRLFYPFKGDLVDGIQKGPVWELMIDGEMPRMLIKDKIIEEAVVSLWELSVDPKGRTANRLFKKIVLLAKKGYHIQQLLQYAKGYANRVAKAVTPEIKWNERAKQMMWI